MEDELRCPKCNSINVSYDREIEYTADGDSWYNYCCEACGYEWRSEVERGYF